LATCGRAIVIVLVLVDAARLASSADRLLAAGAASSTPWKGDNSTGVEPRPLQESADAAPVFSPLQICRTQGRLCDGALCRLFPTEC
jgi:hypothetical protein